MYVVKVVDVIAMLLVSIHHPPICTLFVTSVDIWKENFTFVG